MQTETIVAHRIIDYRTDAVVATRATAQLVAESEDAPDGVGAVSAYVDGDGVAHYVREDAVATYEQCGEAVITVYAEVA